MISIPGCTPWTDTSQTTQLKLTILDKLGSHSNREPLAAPEAMSG